MSKSIGYKVFVIALLGVAIAFVISARKPAVVEPMESAKAPETAMATKSGLPRLVDLGADKCIPCKMMAPVLEQLRKEQAGKLDVVFIDVWKNPDAGREYGIKLIPTQVFFDAKDKEFFRHEGFFPKKDILAVFKKHGIPLAQLQAAGSSKRPASSGKTPQ